MSSQFLSSVAVLTMSISLQKFDDLTAEFPEDRDLLMRLRDLVIAPKQREMTLDHLALKLHARSSTTLAQILEKLTSAGVIRRVFRIESPKTKASIKDVESFLDVPAIIDDWHD